MTLDPTVPLFPNLWPSPSLQPTDAVDPWRDLLIPALDGRPPQDPARWDADLLAAWIRCTLLRGDPDRARRLLPRALEAGHPDSQALSAWLLGRAPPPPRQGPAWQQADACCDRALWLRRVGDHGPARRSLQRAMALTPHHVEAGLLLAVGRRPLPPALQPRQRLGWYSPFRVLRRRRGGAWTSPRRRREPRVQAGVRLRLAPDGDVDGLRLDALADQLSTRRRLGLPTGELAARLWAVARRMGHPTAIRAANLLCRILPPTDPVHRAAAEVVDNAGLPRPVPAIRRSRSPQLPLPPCPPV